MGTPLKDKIKKNLYKIRSYCIAKIGKGIAQMLFWTCKLEIEGLEQFCQTARSKKCMIMLWHNRLALVPFILYRFTPQFIFAALISASRDGDMLSTVVLSYKQGRVIKVPHQARYQALKELIRSIEEEDQIVIITPDGPRGPRYELKPGVAVAALETEASVIPLNWTADKFWELKTWDRLRIPKPFAKIKITFENPVKFNKGTLPSLEQAKATLKNALPVD
jgi:lysophospholipid acyltransferase (LPLAT)-like uncharacterized protein